MVHASLATSVDDIFLNFSLVTPQNKAFKALLLKFAAMIVASSQSTGASFGLIPPTSIACHICSPRAYKKTFIQTFQYAKLVPSNKGGIKRDCSRSMTMRVKDHAQEINPIKVNML